MREATVTAIKATLGVLWFCFWFFLFFPWLLLTEVAVAWKPLTILGASLVIAGLSVVIRITVLFVQRGDGTPVPLDPPRIFVSAGLFRWVRNPMYLAYFTILAGEAILLESEPLAGYALVFTAMTHVYVTRIEEKGLGQRFGASYHDYCETVSRWVPKPPQ